MFNLQNLRITIFFKIFSKKSEVDLAHARSSHIQSLDRISWLST